jgi:hypothetical protein
VLVLADGRLVEIATTVPSETVVKLSPGAELALLAIEGGAS